MVSEGEKLGRRINTICNRVGVNKHERLACKIGASRGMKRVTQENYKKVREAMDVIKNSEEELGYTVLPKKATIEGIGSVGKKSKR